MTSDGRTDRRRRPFYLAEYPPFISPIPPSILPSSPRGGIPDEYVNMNERASERRRGLHAWPPEQKNASAALALPRSVQSIRLGHPSSHCAYSRASHSIPLRSGIDIILMRQFDYPVLNSGGGDGGDILLD